MGKTFFIMSQFLWLHMTARILNVFCLYHFRKNLSVPLYKSSFPSVFVLQEYQYPLSFCEREKGIFSIFPYMWKLLGLSTVCGTTVLWAVDRLDFVRIQNKTSFVLYKNLKIHVLLKKKYAENFQKLGAFLIHWRKGEYTTLTQEAFLVLLQFL